MKFLDKIWDDTMGGPQPDKGLGKLRKYNSFNNTSMASGGDSSMTSQIQSSGSEAMAIPNANGHKRLYLMRSPSISMDGTSPPSSPSAASSSSSPSSTPRERENVWRSVFHPGSNINTNHIGAQKFDKAEPKSPTVYDWLYSGETRSKYR